MAPPWPGDIGPADGGTLDTAQSSIRETQLSVAALNEPLRYGYGRNRVGALMLQPVVYMTNLYLPFIIARGPINQIISVEAGDEALSSYITRHDYLGTKPQAIDTWLVNAWKNQVPSRTYADTLDNIAWSVLEIPLYAAGQSLNAITVEAEMLKLYDPRLDSTNGGSGPQRLADPTTWVYSTNAVLALADFLTNTVYGRGELMDWSTVITCANIADQDMGQVRGQNTVRRDLGLMIDRFTKVDDVENTLRTYAGCWVVREEGLVRLVPDALVTDPYDSPVLGMFDFTNAEGSANYIANSIQIEESVRSDTPTVVTVRWTDTAAKPWRELPWTEPQGNLPASTPYREEVVSMPGIQNSGFAKREALRRLNSYILSDLKVTLLATGEAAQLRKGDLVTLSDTEGFSNKQFRLVGHTLKEPGLWQETLLEYHPALYSDEVAEPPDPNDTILPQPNAPPAVTGVHVEEEVYSTGVGLYSSRFYVTWTAPDWPQSFISYFIIDIKQGGSLVASGTRPGGTTSYRSGPLPENLPYVIEVSIMSVVGARGAIGSDSITNNKKKDPPSDVGSIYVYEIGGEVRAEIVPATDVDMSCHEYRAYAWTGSPPTRPAIDETSIETQWDNATLIDRIPFPSSKMITKDIAPGEWRILVKGRDSIRDPAAIPPILFGQESAHAKWMDLTVTSDTNAFVAASGEYSNPSLMNMIYTEGVWVTSMGDAWNDYFGGSPTQYATGHNDPVWTHHSAGTSAMLSEMADIGALATGDWTLNFDYTDLDGTAVAQMELSTGGESARTVLSATTATPSDIQLSNDSDLNEGDELVLSGCTGTGDVATNLNVRAWIKTISGSPTTVNLMDFAGNDIGITGAYDGSSGSATRWNWTAYSVTTVRAPARYVRGRISTTGTMVVQNPLASYQCNVVARPDGGFYTGSMSGPTIVRFTQPFTKLKSLSVSAIGTGGLTASADKIEVSGGRALQSLDNALRFVDTEYQYVTCPDAAGNQLTMGCTIEAWVKVASVVGLPRIVMKDTTAAGSRNAFGLLLQTAGNATAVLFINNQLYQCISPTSIADDVWHHVAMVWDSNLLRLYVDGVLAGTSGTGGSWTAPTSPLGIGAQPPYSGNGVWGNFFDGCIQEVRLWSVVHSQDDIIDMKDTAAVGSETGLVALYHLNAISGALADDGQTNIVASDGTLTHASPGTLDPSWRPLDGFDGYVWDDTWAQTDEEASWTALGV